jgi:hypothetical protein
VCHVVVFISEDAVAIIHLVTSDVFDLEIKVIEEHLGGGDDRVGRIHPNKSRLERKSGS